MLVLVSLGQGAVNELLSANNDGSWAGDVTFSFSGLPSHTTITATCRDFFGVGSNPYAYYQTHDVQVASTTPPTTTTTPTTSTSSVGSTTKVKD